MTYITRHHPEPKPVIWPAGAMTAKRTFRGLKSVIGMPILLAKALASLVSLAEGTVTTAYRDAYLPQAGTLRTDHSRPENW